MNWNLATDNQLETIAKHDNDCPRSLLGGVVVEMLNRGLFDRIIGECAKRVFGNVRVIENLHKVGLDDFMQIGRIEVLQALKRFDGGKGKNFMSFVFVCVKHQFVKEITYLEAGKRDTRNTLSYNVPTDEGTEMIELFTDDTQNVEKYVVNKVLLEQLIKRVNPHQRKVLFYRMQGYTFAEISQLLGRGSDRTMHQAYRLAVEKMRKGA